MIAAIDWTKHFTFKYDGVGYHFDTTAEHWSRAEELTRGEVDEEAFVELNLTFDLVEAQPGVVFSNDGVEVFNSNGVRVFRWGLA